MKDETSGWGIAPSAACKSTKPYPAGSLSPGPLGESLKRAFEKGYLWPCAASFNGFICGHVIVPPAEAQPIRLWLDDIRDPATHGAIGFVWAKTAEEAIAHLRTGRVSYASLDHDLSIEDTTGHGWSAGNHVAATGYDVVCWMEEHDVWPPLGTVVHSMNPAGKMRMEAVIRRATRAPTSGGTDR